MNQPIYEINEVINKCKHESFEKEKMPIIKKQLRKIYKIRRDEDRYKRAIE